MTIRIRLTRLPHGEGLPLPSYATPGAAGMDVVAAEDFDLDPGERHAVATGFKVAIPEGYEIQVRPRSGLALKHGITVPNTPGTIDSDYRGELKGKLDGSAVRVPTPNVSLVDLTFTPGRETSKEEVNSILKAAAESGPLAGILDYTDEPLVSFDLNHNAASSTVDSLETAVIEGKLVRVVSWYDNEWGFSNRMVDTAGAIAKLI